MAIHHTSLGALNFSADPPTATITATATQLQTEFYFPHVANGVLGSNVWKSTIFLTNPAASGGTTASGTVTFTQDISTNSSAGSPFNISFTDEPGVDRKRDHLFDTARAAPKSMFPLEQETTVVVSLRSQQ